MNNQIIERFLQKNPCLEGQDNFAVAVSGGPDSMALLHMLVVWAEENKKNIHVLTVDHGLRKQAKTEAKMVADWVKGQNFEGALLSHKILQWQGEKPDTAIMEVARGARYQLMADYCEDHNIKILFLGHHQDDQAETFLIRLTKGSGLDGLAGMSELRQYNKHVNLARPLLRELKQDLILYCEGNDIPYANDLSNEDDKYLRPRLRQSTVILEKEGLSSKRLAVTARRLARARHALEEISFNVFEEALLESTNKKLILNFLLLQSQPEEISLRVIQKALEVMRPNADYNARMEKLEKIFESLWYAPEYFKPRTLGGCIFTLKNDKVNKNTVLCIEKEKR